MPGRPRTPAARAIIYAGAIGQLTQIQVNELLDDAGLSAQAIGEPSFKWIKRDYVPYFLKHPEALGEMIYHPRPVGDFTDD